MNRRVGQCRLFAGCQKDAAVMQVINRIAKTWTRTKNARSRLIEDSIGDKAMEVWITLDDKTTNAEVTGETCRQIEQGIRNAVSRLMPELFVYVYFAREKELQES